MAEECIKDGEKKVGGGIKGSVSRGGRGRDSE